MASAVCVCSVTLVVTKSDPSSKDICNPPRAGIVKTKIANGLPPHAPASLKLVKQRVPRTMNEVAFGRMPGWESVCAAFIPYAVGKPRCARAAIPSRRTDCASHGSPGVLGRIPGPHPRSRLKSNGNSARRPSPVRQATPSSRNQMLWDFRHSQESVKNKSTDLADAHVLASLRTAQYRTSLTHDQTILVGPTKSIANCRNRR